MILPIGSAVVLVAAGQQAVPGAAIALRRPDTAPVVVIAARPARLKREPGDPHERFNRRMFAAQQKFDRKLLRPAALGYRHAVPRPVRGGLRHFFSNLGEPIVFLNYLLQLRPGKAAETAGRFMINSTLGIGGLLDLAKSKGVRLPHRPNGLGDTLGYYGVKPGAYLFLPFIGPTTVRDLLGGQADGLVLPLAVGAPFNKLGYQIPKAVITGLDRREQADDDYRALLDGAVDPYATLRSVYLQERAGEIAQLKGKRAGSVQDELIDPLDDPADTAMAPLADEQSDLLIGPAAIPGASSDPRPAASDPAAPARR